MAKKVGDLENGKEIEEKKKGRLAYDSAELKKVNAKAVNEDGLLTVAPPDYHHRKNLPLKKEAFATEAVYIRYQSMIASQKAEFYVTKSSELTGKADRLEKFGSEVARKAATKLARAKTQMATLRQQLIDTGMSEAELDALIEDM